MSTARPAEGPYADSSEVLSMFAPVSMLKDTYKDRLFSASLWLTQVVGSTYDAEPISLADRRQRFWDAHSQLGQMILVRQHPMFAPDHEVWKTNNASAAMNLLTQTMHLSICNTVLAALKDLCESFILGLVAIWTLYFVCLGPFFVDNALVPKYALIALAVPVILSAAIVWFAYAWWRPMKQHWEKVRQAILSSPEWTNMRSHAWVDEDSKLERAFIDPGEYQEALNCFHAGDASEAFWVKLDELVDKHLITRAERRQLFWDLYNGNRKTLTDISPLLSPQDAFWYQKGESATEETDKALTRWLALEMERREWILLTWFFEGWSLATMRQRRGWARAFMVLCSMLQAYYSTIQAFRIFDKRPSVKIGAAGRLAMIFAGLGITLWLKIARRRAERQLASAIDKAYRPI